MTEDWYPGEHLQAREKQLRVLAEKLIGDPDLAEDLVQETLLASLSRRWSPARWWSETLRLKARQVRVGERSRRRRERAAAIRESATSSPEESERIQLLKSIGEEVGKLDEPYRTTLRMRFLDELPPREIAQLENIPVRTVYTRVSRGLKLLRERMDQRFGALVWFPLLNRWLGPHTSHAGLRWGSRAVVAVFTFALLGAVIWRFTSDSALPPNQPSIPTVSGSLPESDSLQGTRSEVAKARQAEPVSAPTVVEQDSSAVLHRGRVVDPAGSELAGLQLLIQHGDIVSELGEITYSDFQIDREVQTDAASDERGEFSLLIDPDLEGRLIATGDGYQSVIAELLPATPREEELVLVAAPEHDLSGRVLDPLGRPLEGVEVRFRPPAEYVVGIRRLERSWGFTVPKSTTGADGRFEMSDAYWMNAPRLQLSKKGFVTSTVTLEGNVRVLGDLVLEPQRELIVRGQVLDEDNAPVEKALVVAGYTRVLTDKDGAFELEPRGLELTNAIWAIDADRLPARLDLATDENGAFDLPETIVLRLGGEPLTIQGQVVDHEGSSLAGTSVWIFDPTPPGADAGAWFVEPLLDPTQSTGVPHLYPTDEEGRFRIPFLIDREYRLGAILGAGGSYAISEPIAAGSEGVLLHVPTDEPLELVAGWVVTTAGERYTSARIQLHLPAVEVPFPNKLRFLAQRSSLYIDVDDQGRFEFEPLPLHGYTISAKGNSIMPISIEIPPGSERHALEIVAPRPARLRVVCTSIDPPPTHAVLLAAGRKTLGLFSAEDYDKTHDLAPFSRAPFGKEGTQLLIVPDTAETLILMRGKTIVHETAVELSVHDEVNLIEI